MGRESKCPHCQAEIVDLWEYEGLKHDGDTIRAECPSCDGDILITLELQAYYEVKKDPNPEIKKGEPGSCT